MSSNKDFSGCSRDVLHRTVDDEEPFCTQENWQSAVIYLSQELELLGYSSICSSENGQGKLDVISLVNTTWNLYHAYRNCLKNISDLEVQARRMNGDFEHLSQTSSRQKDLLELKDRQFIESDERERQSQLQVHRLAQDLKIAKEEARRFSAVLLQRESRFSHEAKRRDQEIAKLKERLLKMMAEKAVVGSGRVAAASSSSSHPAIEITGGFIGKPEGKSRARWRTENEEQKREDHLLHRVIQDCRDQQDKLANENQLLKESYQNLQCKLYQLMDMECQRSLSLDKMDSQAQQLIAKVQSMVADANNATNCVVEDNLSQLQEEFERTRKAFLVETFSLGTFVPLSDVKHAAPPEWSNRPSCTLPPSGRPTNVPWPGHSVVTGQKSKPRPRSANLSPYRGMQVQGPSPMGGSRLLMSATGAKKKRTGSTSPAASTSTSPTRKLPGDTRSLPRMTGTRLTLVGSGKRTPNYASSNNSSADEGPSRNLYNSVRRRAARKPADSSSDCESSSANESLSTQLKRLGQYMERREVTNASPVLDDTQMDVHLENIRRAIASQKLGNNK